MKRGTLARSALVRSALVLWGAVLLTAPPPGHPPAGAGNADLANADSTPAPVPDFSVGGPPAASEAGPAASVRPGISRPGLGPDGRSQGYTPHSSYTDSLDGRFHAMPTLNLSVKLQ